MILLYKPFYRHFYPNVTTLHSGLCYHKSICLSSVVCRLSSSCSILRGLKLFGNISLPVCYLATLWPPCKVLRKSSQGNPCVRGIKLNRGSKVERRWTYRRLYLIAMSRWVCHLLVSFLYLLLRPGRGAEYCDQPVCLCVCLSVCLSASISLEPLERSTR